MPSSLASGAIDGYCVAEPFGAQAITQNYGHVLARSDDLWEDSVCCGLIFRSEVIQKDQESFNTFLKEYKRAGNRLNTKEAIRIAEKYLGQDAKTLKTSLKWISYDDLEITKEAYQELYEKVNANQMIENAPTYKDFVYTAKGD